MKRYKPRLGMVFNPKGDWIKFEDSKAEIFRISEIYENRIRELEGKKSAECNCRKEYEYRKSNPYQWIWICPAHGYKRL